MNRKSFTNQLRQPWGRYAVSRPVGVKSARLRLNITISYEVKARGNAPIRKRSLFYWRRTRVRLAKIVSRLAVGILPVPREFFTEYVPAHELLRVRRQWNAAAAEHLSHSAL
jgi:hypothetical protein